MSKSLNKRIEELELAVTAIEGSTIGTNALVAITEAITLAKALDINSKHKDILIRELSCMLNNDITGIMMGTYGWVKSSLGGIMLDYKTKGDPNITFPNLRVSISVGYDEYLTPHSGNEKEGYIYNYPDLANLYKEVGDLSSQMSKLKKDETVVLNDRLKEYIAHEIVHVKDSMMAVIKSIAVNTEGLQYFDIDLQDCISKFKIKELP